MRKIELTMIVFTLAIITIFAAVGPRVVAVFLAIVLAAALRRGRADPII